MLPRHLRFLESFTGARHKALKHYFPRTAAGALKPSRGEGLFTTESVYFVGPLDGTMIPIQADNLEPMPENIFYADKFSALVDALQDQRDLVLDPGYADLTVEDGQLVAQVRDGNHRTFAPVVAGSSLVWVLLSDNTRQSINDRTPGSDATYRAIRAAQKDADAPLFKRQTHTKAKPTKAFQELAAAERALLQLREDADAYYSKMLRTHGKATAGFNLSEQLERPQLFWRMRLQELKEEHGAEWVFDHVHDTPEGRAQQERNARLSPLVSSLQELRQKAGLRYGEQLDPTTMQVVRANPAQA